MSPSSSQPRPAYSIDSWDLLHLYTPLESIIWEITTKALHLAQVPFDELGHRGGSE